MRLLLKAISRRQEKAVDFFGTLSWDVSVDQAWVDDIILSTNLLLVYIKAHIVYQFA